MEKEHLKYLDFFKNRSTLRKYSSDKEVSDDTLATLLDAASHAPTTGNMQLYSVVATRSDEMKERLAPLHFNQPTVKGCSVMLTFCADLRRFERWCEERGADPGFRNYHSFITALIDTALFAQQFVTLAELNGIGSCYLGTVTYSAEKIAEVLELPDRVVPVICLTVGYPEEKGVFPPASDRIPVEGVLHKETYKDYTKEDIDRIFEYKENLEESKRFVEENGKTSLAQVFTDIRYPGKMNEEVSESFARIVKGKGF
ncbi:MAG: nitroreductase family protein [Muribaculaceae bacterium]|nr:nitroreductase family protein [Muribaculaceae bacterium]